MRISMNQNSPYFQVDAQLYEVFCDGVKITGCFEACEESGRAWVMKAGGDLSSGGFQLTVMKGTIKIVKAEE